ncbi:hypothetical protein [Alicyclobacillus shizuokensis]|nr:hypothetical protein [Alicyclobacillus shizuokensis]MCL6626736.1 hypothetical protein [Alicyclobacillus shizuokensis]
MTHPVWYDTGCLVLALLLMWTLSRGLRKALDSARERPTPKPPREE